MELNLEPRDHRYGTCWDRLRNIHPRYLTLTELDAYHPPTSTDSSPSPTDFPYPVLNITDDYQLHLYPAHDHIRTILVRASDGEVLSDGHEPYGFWFTIDGIQNARENTIAQAENYTNQTAPRSLTTALEETLTTHELLHDPFSNQLTKELRPLTIRWLRDRTQSVTADIVEYTGGAYIKTKWTIELAPGSKHAEDATRTLEFHTDDLLQQDSQRLIVDYRSLYHQGIHCSNSWWVDLSSYWLSSATVRDVVDDDYPDQDPSAFSFRQSGNAKWHLVRNETDRTVCQHDARSNETRPFTPDNLPFPPALCNHCSQSVKRHLIAQQV